MKRLSKLLLALLPFAIVGCDDIDCTLNNVVLCNYYFYSSEEGSAVAIADTLTVMAWGTDSILYNKGVSTSSVSVPMSYWMEADTLQFMIVGENYAQECIFVVEKTNTEYFESPDCPAAMFHEITNVTYLSDIIDSVVVTRSDVNFLQDENIRIYFNTGY